MVKKVSLLLPRVVDVNRFAQARVQEIEQLVDELAGSGKLGEAAQARNIRRRARSHRGRNHRYRENQKKKKKNQQELIGEKRKREDKDEEQTVNNVGEDGGEEEEGISVQEFSNRRMRRRAGRMFQQILKQGKQLEDFKISSMSTEPSQNIKLETHLWHAKRFIMDKRWGYMLSRHLFGAGAGSRSLLKKYKKGAILHDASYWNPIEIQIKHNQDWERALQILRDCLEEGENVIKELSSFGFSAGRSVWNKDTKNFGQVIYIVVGDDKKEKVKCKQILLLAHPACYLQVYDHLMTVFPSGVVIPRFGEIKMIQVLGTKSREVVEDCCNIATSQLGFHCCTIQSSRYQLMFNKVQDPRFRNVENHSQFQKTTQNCVEKTSEELESFFTTVSKCKPPLSDDVVNNFMCQNRKQLLGISNVKKNDFTTDGCSLEFPAIFLCQADDHQNLENLNESLMLVPAAWERLLWNQLTIEKGVLGVAGQSELRWIYTNQKILCFPYDYPDFDPTQQPHFKWEYIGKPIPQLITLLQKQHQQEQQQKLKKQQKISKKIQKQPLEVVNLLQNPEEINIEEDDDDENVILPCQQSVCNNDLQTQRILVRKFTQIEKILLNEFNQQWKPICGSQFNVDSVNQQNLTISKNYKFNKFVHVSVSVVGKGCCQEGSLIVCEQVGLAVGIITSASVPGCRNFPGGLGVVSVEWFGEQVEDKKYKVKCSLLNKGSDTLREISIKLLAY